jgi:hypothetical protein
MTSLNSDLLSKTSSALVDFKNNLSKEVSNIKFNDIATSLLYLVLVLYASLVRPDLPNFMNTLFKNNLFRILVFFLIVYLSEKEGNFTLALLIALVFFVTMNFLTEKEVELKLTQQLKNHN